MSDGKGEAGRDKLRGGDDDVLIGGGDRDVHSGGGGRDILRAKDGRKDRVLGGPGRDRGRVDRVDVVVSVEVIQ